MRCNRCNSSAYSVFGFGLAVDVDDRRALLRTSLIRRVTLLTTALMRLQAWERDWVYLAGFEGQRDSIVDRLPRSGARRGAGAGRR